MNEVLQYIPYLLSAIGVMAFLVSAITQVIKAWPGLDRIPTAAVVIVLSLVLCPVSMAAAMAWMQQPITWYMILGWRIAPLSVAQVA